MATAVMVGILSGETRASASAILLHQYQLNGTYGDDLGGPSLVSNGGALGPTGYTFGGNQGLKLSNAISQDDYSIVLDFSITTTSGYRKLVDLKNLTSDSGLYDNGARLVYYNAASGSLVSMAATTPVRVAFTRDAATQAVAGYVNGVFQFGFVDTGNAATFTGPNSIINFFIDDVATSQNEASAGFADSIRIYNGALTAAYLATLGPAVDMQQVPEPTTMLLLGTGLIVLARRLRKR